MFNSHTWVCLLCVHILLVAGVHIYQAEIKIILFTNLKTIDIYPYTPNSNKEAPKKSFKLHLEALEDKEGICLQCIPCVDQSKKQ